MAITAMGIIKKINNSPIKSHCLATLLIWLIMPSPVLAGDLQLIPSLSLNETYTDNVELTASEPTSSLVTQTIAGLNAYYLSPLAGLALSGTKSYAFYSHDSKLNNDYRSLNASGHYSFWTSGPSLIVTANIINQSRNNADNSTGDLISGDTVEIENYSTGLQYNVRNSTHSIQSSVIYNIIRAEDRIGDSDGFTAQLSSKNGNDARDLYWQLSGRYTKREGRDNGINNVNNVNTDGENSTVEAIIGTITSWNLNPFVRFYDEDVKGSGVAGNSLAFSSSWGPGVRWLASPHLTIDLSYNFAADETVSDDYIAASLQWEPSARTSLTAGYSQRFFGDSYNLNFKHKTKRLTNLITYTEDLQLFDRNSYQETNSNNIELVDSDEFSLNKRFAWSSKLQFARTSFDFRVLASQRESLKTNVIDEKFDADLTITRKTGAKSSLSLLAKYKYLIFDKENPEGSRQEDHYRTFSASFTRNLSSSLSSHFTMQHLNRSSNIDRYSYDEMRAIINITKEF